MREHIAFQLSIIDLNLDDLQKDFGGVEVKDAKHHFGHVKLWLQELSIDLVALDMHIKGTLRVCIDVFLVDLEQVECNVIRVRLNGIRKEVNMEWDLVFFDELQWKSEPPCKNENLNYLILDNEFWVIFQKL